MIQEAAQAHAVQWIADWNRRDVAAVAAHFADDVTFTSPRAAATVGTPTVRGKAALRDYWLAAMARIQSLHFTLDHALWDVDAAELAIVYTAAINGQTTRAVEVLRFDASGHVIRGEAFHGATV